MVVECELKVAWPTARDKDEDGRKNGKIVRRKFSEGYAGSTVEKQAGKMRAKRFRGL